MAPCAIIRSSLFLALVAFGRMPRLAAQDAKSEVHRTAQAMFDAMGRRDTASLRRLVHPMAHLIAVVETGDSVTSRVTSRDQFLAQIAWFPIAPLERLWDPEIRVSGPIASIWTPYDFHRGKEFSHCGIDSFQLVRSKAGWVITSIIYTVVGPASRCQPSPLGQPR